MVFQEMLHATNEPGRCQVSEQMEILARIADKDGRVVVTALCQELINALKVRDTALFELVQLQTENSALRHDLERCMAREVALLNPPEILIGMPNSYMAIDSDEPGPQASDNCEDTK